MHVDINRLKGKTVEKGFTGEKMASELGIDQSIRQFQHLFSTDATSVSNCIQKYTLSAAEALARTEGDNADNSNRQIISVFLIKLPLVSFGCFVIY